MKAGGKNSVKGIDISSYQGRINWASLAHSDIRFAYIKATQGTQWVRPGIHP